MQKAYWNYKSGLNSNDFRDALLGLIQPGRYRGFDNLVTPGSSLNFTLDHLSTGLVETLENLTLSNPTSVVVTKQGFIIKEDASIALTCLTNATNAFYRYDYVVLEHEDVNTPGGQPGTYLVLKGPDGGPVLPTLTSPNTQTIIGIITIPPSASNLDSATWTKAQAPLIGGNTLLGGNFPELNDTYARLASPNIFTKQNIISPSPTTIDSQVSSGKFTVPDDGNLFYGGICTINEISAPNIANKTGLEITLMSSGGTITINVGATPTQGGYPIKAIGFEAHSYTSLTLVGYENITLKWMGVYWVITSMTDTIFRKMKIYNPNKLITKVVNIGDWNMDANQSKSVNHGIADYTKVRAVSVIIIADNGTQYFPLNRASEVISSPLAFHDGWIDNINSLSIDMQRTQAGAFDNTNFDATSFNRGYITITYVEH